MLSDSGTRRIKTWVRLQTGYERQRAGLAREFLDALVATIQLVAEQPLSFPAVHRGIRRALIERFPFGIYFLAMQADIVVIGVLHGSSHQHSWQERT